MFNVPCETLFAANDAPEYTVGKMFAARRSSDPFHSMDPRILTWLNHNVSGKCKVDLRRAFTFDGGPYGITRHYREKPLGLTFSDINDALLFKLTWGGAQ